MKMIFLAAIAACSLSSSFAQSKDLLIVPCKSGELVIDGISKGRIEAEDAHPETLAAGDHYIQIKTDKGKINSTVHVDAAMASNIVRVGCETHATGGIRLVDKQLNLSGGLSTDTEDNYFGLDNGDELSIHCEVLNKKGTVTLSIVQYGTDAEIYRKEGFNLMDNETVRIPKRGIYKIMLYTDALFGKNARLVVDRIPSRNSSPDFRTTVHVASDTTTTEVLNTTVRVFSTTNLDHENKTVLRVNLPANTTYWVYWIGVGQESKDLMKNFTSRLSAVGKFMYADPLALFGLNLISELPMMNVPSTVNYRFMNAQNAQLFASSGNYSYYTFKYGNNISTDYSLIQATTRDLSLCFWNESTFTGQDVTVRVQAFSVRRWLEMDAQ